MVSEKPTDQISHFYYWVDISYGINEALENKIQGFKHICGTISKTVNKQEKIPENTNVQKWDIGSFTVG